MRAFSDYRVLLLFIIPVALNIVFLLRRSEQSRQWRSEGESLDFHPVEAFVSLFIYGALTLGMWHWGVSQRINHFDEQIGGYVTAVWSEDGSHTETYDCNCSTDADGNRSCNTCSRTIEHRDFHVTYDIGDWYNGSNWYERVNKPCGTCEPYSIPQRYLDSYVGKPVSLPNSYPNYIAAMNDNVYLRTYEGLATVLPDICPEAPDIRSNEHSVYKAFPVGFDKVAPLRAQVYDWNFYPGRDAPYMTSRTFENVPLYMDTMFGFLGKEVQADVHLYVFNSTNAEYAQMCLAKWKNGAKNSVYVFLFGSSDGTYYQASDVYVGVAVDGTSKNSELAFTNDAERSNYYMKYDMRNELLTYFQSGGTLDRHNVLSIVFRNVYQKFVRQEMAEFKDLRNHILPANGWFIVMAIVLLVVDVVAHFLFANNDL